MTGPARLSINNDDLDSIKSTLTRVVNVLNDEDNKADALAADVGHARLGQKVTSFSHAWDIHRNNMRENMEWLRDAVDKINTEFCAVDTDLAAGLKGDQ